MFGDTNKHITIPKAATAVPPRTKGPLSNVARRGKVKFFLRDVSHDARILDIGCGENWVKRAASAREITDVTGLDLYEPADVIGDVQSWRSLGLEPHSFDVIMAFEVVEHGDFWESIGELLKPDGLLFVTTPVPAMDGVCRVLEAFGLLQRRTTPHTHLIDLRSAPGFDVVERHIRAGVSQWAILTPKKVARSQGDLPPASLYSEAYFLSNACEGLSDYRAGRVSIVRQRELDRLDVREGMRFLDIGCGRGEALLEAVHRGASAVGIDYSWDAVRLSGDLVGGKAPIVQADGTALPFRDGAFDRVLMGDVIEHIPWDLAIHLLREVERILAPGGAALVHTSPNTWFTAIVRPPLQIVLRLLHNTEALFRFAEYDRLRAAMHPNELNPRSLASLMTASGLIAHSWVDRDIMRSGASEWTSMLTRSRLIRWLAALGGVWPLRLVLGNDLYAHFRKG